MVLQPLDLKLVLKFKMSDKNYTHLQLWFEDYVCKVKKTMHAFSDIL